MKETFGDYFMCEFLHSDRDLCKENFNECCSYETKLKNIYKVINSKKYLFYFIKISNEHIVCTVYTQIWVIRHTWKNYKVEFIQ